MRTTKWVDQQHGLNEIKKIKRQTECVLMTVTTCLKQVRFAFSPDNDDNLRSCLFTGLFIVFSVITLLSVPYIGYVGSFVYKPLFAADESTLCTCLNTTLSYNTRYGSCSLVVLMMVVSVAVTIILCLCIRGIWKYKLPLLRTEIENAFIPPPKEEIDDESPLFSHDKKQSLWWLVTTDNPNRLFKQQSHSLRWLSIVLIIILTPPVYVLGAYVGRAFNIVCLGEICYKIIPCNVTTEFVDFSIPCAMMSIICIFFGILVLVTMIIGLYKCIGFVPVAFKDPAEIDSIRALKTMDRAII